MRTRPKKTPLEAVQTVIKWTKRILKYVNQDKGAVKYEEEQNIELIKRLKYFFGELSKTTDKQMDIIEKEIGSIKVANSCINAKKIVDKWHPILLKKKQLNYTKTGQLIKDVEKIRDIEDVIFREIEAHSYELDKYTIVGNAIGSGLFSKVFEIKENSTLLIKLIGSSIPEEKAKKSEFRKVKKIIELEKELEKNVQITRTIDFGVIRYNHELFVATIMHKAIGEHLYDHSKHKTDEQKLQRFSEISKIKQSHYTKLISNIKILTKNKIKLDLGNVRNIFYDKNKGFTLTDLEPFMKSKDKNQIEDLEYSFLFEGRLEGEFLEKLTSEDINNFLTIYLKFIRAGYIPVRLKLKIQTFKDKKVPFDKSLLEKIEKELKNEIPI